MQIMPLEHGSSRKAVRMKAVDCQGLGGGMTLGMVQAGFEIVEKHEQPGGFGFAQHADNAHLLGTYPMRDEVPEAWSTPDDRADLVFGCPPCSGFSALSVRAGGRDMRSPEASINHCMWDFWRYAARVDPQVIAMESVPQAGKMGITLMRALHRELMTITGHGWYLSHVFHNNLSVGGGSQRPRYFLVATADRPFGITSPLISRVPALHDVIGDLAKLPLTMDDQPRLDTGDTWWRIRKTRADGLVSGHGLPDSGRRQHLIKGICESGWRQGEMMIVAVERFWHETGGKISDDGCEIISEGQWPDGFTDVEKRSMLYRPVEKRPDFEAVQRGEMSEQDYLTKWRGHQMPHSAPHAFVADMYQPSRWYDDRPARVFNGGSMSGPTHPTENRTFTYREAARIMGFPDAWNVGSYVGQEATFGKAVSVDAAYWLGHHLAQHIDGATDVWTGDEVTDEGSWLARKIDTTNDWQSALDDKRGEARRKLMAARPA